MLKELKLEMKKLSDIEKANILARFFKTGLGEYGAGDKFMGVTVTAMRKLLPKYKDLSLLDCEKLLQSAWHEERMMAVIILHHKFKTGNIDIKRKIYQTYIKNIKQINNWDLVDLSAYKIFGEWWRLSNKNPLPILQKYSQSKNLWYRRIAIIATFAYIKNGEFKPTLKIAEILLIDKEDLIHKAVGWMLREVGNRNQKAEEIFLKKYYKKMPRTMLRYAIEKFPEQTRLQYLKGQI